MFRFATLWLAAVLSLAGCQKKPAAPSATPAPTPIPTPTPENPRAIRIGFFVSQTGEQSSFGLDATKGAQLAVKEINAAGGVLGRPLALVERDTQSRSDITSAVVTELIDKKRVSVLVGEIATDRSLVAAPLAQAAGIPMITPGSTHESLTQAGDGIFRACYTDLFQAIAMSKFARSIDAQTAAVIFDPSSPYGSDLATIFKTDFTSHGGQIVAQATYQTGDKDFSAQLNAIKSRMPEVIFLPCYYTEAALIISQARQLGMDMPFLGTDGWDSAEFLKVGGDAVNNCYFSSHFSAENTASPVSAFVQAYSSAYGQPPPPLAALSYDTIYLVADAIKRADSTESSKIKTALATTAGFQGVTGTIAFDENRNPTKPAIVIRIQKGKFTYLETSSPK